MEKVIIGSDKDKYFQVGAQVEKGELLVFLRDNMNVFAYNTYEAPRVGPNFICHHFNTNPTIMSKRHPWRSTKEHAEAVKEEVNKLE